jgi:hypothetical protein
VIAIPFRSTIPDNYGQLLLVAVGFQPTRRRLCFPFVPAPVAALSLSIDVKPPNPYC